MQNFKLGRSGRMRSRSLTIDIIRGHVCAVLLVTHNKRSQLSNQRLVSKQVMMQYLNIVDALMGMEL